MIGLKHLDLRKGSCVLAFAHLNIDKIALCRAGQKLDAALDHFGLEVRGMRVLDAGLSTGGFTDCLLQRGAAHVIGVDVGYGQVLVFPSSSLFVVCTAP